MTDGSGKQDDMWPKIKWCSLIWDYKAYTASSTEPLMKFECAIVWLSQFELGQGIYIWFRTLTLIIKVLHIEFENVWLLRKHFDLAKISQNKNMAIIVYLTQGVKWSQAVTGFIFCLSLWYEMIVGYINMYRTKVTYRELLFYLISS